IVPRARRLARALLRSPSGLGAWSPWGDCNNAPGESAGPRARGTRDACGGASRCGTLKERECPPSFEREVVMSHRPPKPRPQKSEVVAFKVEKELADLLNKLPNKSAFIRKAIEAQLGRACPLCNGKGVVPRGVHDHYLPLLKQLSARDCDGCGSQLH